MSQLGPYDLVTQIGDILPTPSTLPFHTKPGNVVPFFCSVYQLGVLSSPTTITFELEDSAGNITSGTVVQDTPGTFESDNLIPLTAATGVWTARWQTSGQAYETKLAEDSFYVDSLYF